LAAHQYQQLAYADPLGVNRFRQWLMAHLAETVDA
jgi:hypothetical protein